MAEFIKQVQGLNRNYRALAKNLDADAPRLAANLKEVNTALLGLRQQGQSANVANKQDQQQIAALTQQVAKLAKEYQELKEAQAGQATVRKQVADATKQATSELKRLQGELRAAFDAKDAERATKAALAIQQYKNDTEQLNRALRGANSTYTAVLGSYNNLSLATEQLGRKIKALPGGFDNTSEEAQKLKAQFYANTQQLKDFDRELNQNFREVGAYARGIIEATQALNQQKAALTQQLQALRLQNNATGLSAEQYKKLRAEIDRTETELTKVTGQLQHYGVAAKRGGDATGIMAGGAANLSQTLLGTYLSITGLLAGLTQIFEANAKYSDQLASVRKTTGLTSEATDQLAENLKKIDTRTSLQGLLDIAKVAGQLGVAGKDIEDFTKAIDVATQALEDDFSGGAEQIATELGKISTVFRKNLGPDQAQNIILIGSAVNELAASGAATAPFLTDVALRTGAVAANARLGLKDVLAYAAVLQETGFNAETSGTALNRLFNTLSTRTEASFKIAQLAQSNLTLTEFKRLINTDFQAALTLFLRGLREGGTSTTKFNGLLGTLKLQSGEAKSVITTLAQNVELLSDKQAIASDQLARGTSLGKEAAIVNNNLAGSWNKLKNDVSNFFSSGTGGQALKWFIDMTRAGLNFKEGFGAIPRLLGLTKPAVDDFGSSLATQALGLRKSADGTEMLLARYESLRRVLNPTLTQQRQLRDTVLQLKTRLGEEAVVLNQQTGQWELNTLAVRKNLGATRSSYQEAVVGLAKRLKALDDEKARSEATALAIQEEATARERLVKSQVKLQPGQDFDAVLRGQAAQRAKTPATYDRSAGALSPATLQAYQQYVELTQQAQGAANQAAVADANRNKVLAQLKRLGLDAAGAYTYLIQATQDDKAATDDSVEADKKKKQSVADLAREQYELAKARLEARVADLDRQAGNPANTEALRTEAIRKATQARIELAALERDELIRQAVKTYKDQVGGERAAQVARVRLTEEFSRKKLGIERDGDQQLLALHNALLDQLSEIDRLIIDTELQALDQVVGDEQRSQQERQQAVLDGAARRIELAEIEAEARKRAAKGDAVELARIEQELQAKRTQILAAVRPFNADFANADLEQKYLKSQLALENSRKAGILTERQYDRERRELERKFNEEKQRNYAKDTTKQREALQQQLDNTKANTDAQIAEMQRLNQERADLIQEGLSAVEGFASSYFQIRENRRQQELQNLTLQKDFELKNAGENAELKAQIEERYRQRELAMRRKQAKADKTAALFQVGLNTAMAVTSVLSTGGGTRYADFGVTAGILSAVVIAAGLAQAAAIASKPLPQYWKGRQGGPEEWAIVGDRGREIIEGRSGGAQLIDKPSVVHLKQGDTVHTNADTERLLRAPDFDADRWQHRRYTAGWQQGADSLQRLVVPVAESPALLAAVNGMRGDQQALAKAFASRPEYHYHLGPRGLEEWVKQGDSWTHYVNRRHRRNG
ncbi:phage tail tape measure protein [Hymenobacter sp. 15J16-1T3B]|uniref:phage tail tape measure protein n=1 Tax=Hymenobacter sp. 15J16-1T3B TaxID=2886941 RepID=UPI001D129B8B|nr:phage tail tape measure protein [Hymenobacter sp. 15J16-1T3B]MCC3156428.1 phage tail tape measure protein [Hymenobacter sp. 15J16-1T3B]